MMARVARRSGWCALALPALSAFAVLAPAQAADDGDAARRATADAASYTFLFDRAQELEQTLHTALAPLMATRRELARDEALIRAIDTRDTSAVMRALESFSTRLRETRLTLYDRGAMPFARVHFDRDANALLDRRDASQLAALECHSSLVLDALIEGAKPIFVLAPACEEESASFGRERVLFTAEPSGVGCVSLVQGIAPIESMLDAGNRDGASTFRAAILTRDGTLVEASDAASAPAWLRPPVGAASLLAASSQHGPRGLFLASDELELLVIALDDLSAQSGFECSLVLSADPKLLGERVHADQGDDLAASVRLTVLLVLALGVLVVIGLIARKRVRAATLAIREATSQSDLERNRLISGVSHDIRGPLGAIMGYADLVRTDANYRNDPVLRENAFEAIKRSCQFILRLTDHLLDLRSAALGRLAIESRCTDVLAICEECVSTYSLDAREKGLTLSFAHPGLEQVKVLGDPTRVRQIVQNLVGNAVRYTERGSVTLALWVPQSQRNTIELSVTDTGVGISPEGLTKIFAPFYQETRATESARSGTGLGLAVVKTIVDALHGSIEVTSERGVGTTFIVKLPVEPWVEADASIPLKAQEQPRAAVAAVEPSSPREEQSASVAHARVDADQGPLLPLAGMQVVFADDYAEAREITSYLLRSAGGTVSVFSSGNDLVQAMQCGLGADCVLLDLQMPGLSGHDSALALRKSGYEGPMIALSGMGDEYSMQRSVECGFAEHIVKPGDPLQLQEIIARLVERHRAESAAKR